MKRAAEKQLLNWYQSTGRKPLILKGARQVGKSTLVRNFAKANSLKLMEINFEKTKLVSLHREEFNLKDVLLEIESVFQEKITQTTLLFLDEIQTDPRAIWALRYFYEERPDLAVIGAGSLLDVALEASGIPFPVGRISYFHLGPMTFSECLSASGKEQYDKCVLDGDLKDYNHERLLEELKKFMFIGGMPKAVLTFIETSSMEEVRKVHQDIFLGYVNDFPKYGKRLNLDRLEHVFQKIPMQLGKKIIFQHLDRESKSIENKKAFEILVKAGVILPAYHTDASGIPLKASIDHTISKAYFLDTGLVNHVHELSWNSFNELFDGELSTKGLLAEQFIAQHLAFPIDGSSPPELLFWLRDKSNQKAEVDFILQREMTIVPIEVKSQKGGHLKSLIYFSKEKNISEAIKFSKEFVGLETLDVGEGKTLKVRNFPLYAVESIMR